MANTDTDVMHGVLIRLLEAFRSRGASGPDGGADVSEHQARILRQLDTRDPTMVGELADFMGVTAATMSLNLTRLEAAGHVERTRDPDDRRVKNVRLTETGRRIRDESGPLDAAAVDAALGTLRPDERRRVAEGLRLLGEAVDRWAARSDAYLGSLTGRDPD